jgi:hypothetical protein
MSIPLWNYKLFLGLTLEDSFLLNMPDLLNLEGFTALPKCVILHQMVYQIPHKLFVSDT